MLFFMVTDEASSIMFVANLNKYLELALIGKGLQEAHTPPPPPPPAVPALAHPPGSPMCEQH